MIRLFKFSNFLSTCLGIGLVSWIPACGTIVSLLSIIPWYILSIFFNWKILFVLLILITILGCYVCHQTNKDIGVHDHRCIVLDEFIGMWFILILSPNSIDYFILPQFFGFLFFRMFDIYKLWPVSYIDRNVRNGLGIVFDDVVSAIIAIILVYLIFYYDMYTKII